MKHPDLEEILSEIKTELRESFLIDFYEKNFRNIDIDKEFKIPEETIKNNLVNTIKSLIINNSTITYAFNEIWNTDPSKLKKLILKMKPFEGIELYLNEVESIDDKLSLNISESLNNLFLPPNLDNAVRLYTKIISNRDSTPKLNFVISDLLKRLIPKINIEKAIELYKDGLKHRKSVVRENALNSLELLIPRINSQKAIELYLLGVNNSYLYERSNISKSLEILIQKIDSQKAIELYENGLKHRNIEVKIDFSKCLKTLIQKIDSQKAIELYETGINHENEEVIMNISSSFETLIQKIDSQKALELYTSGLNHKNEKVRKNISSSFGSLIQIIDTKKAIELYLDGINHPIDEVKNSISSSFGNLIQIIDNKKALELYISGLNHKNEKVRKNISSSFGSLIQIINSQKAIELYKNGIQNIGIKNKIGSFFNLLFEKVSQDTDNILKNHNQFIEDYMNSKYVKEGDNFKSKEQIITELMGVVQNPNRNYLNMSQIVKAGKATNLEEIIECSEFESTEGELFLSRLGDGGVAGVAYMVYSPKLKKNIAVKVLKKGKYNPKEVEVLNKLAGDEEKLENIVRFIHAPDNQISRNGENVETIFMEFIDGENLETIYNQNSKGLEESIALNYSRQLLKGILDLRRKEIFHRDIHLGNVMIDNLGKLKIVDFGIAEDNLNAEPESNLRHGGVTDLVSWAFITYELFTGEHLLYNRQTVVDNKTNIRDEIRKRRDEMLDENGGLKQEYLRKIHENIPRSLFLPVTFALSHSDMEPISNVLKDYFFGFLYKPELEKYFLSHGLNIIGLNDSFYSGLEDIITKNKKYIV